MERPKPAAFDSIFASYRPRNRPRLLFFLVKMDNFHSTDPGCWVTAANRSRKVKRDSFQIVNYRWEPVQKLELLIGTRSNGTKDAIILSFFFLFFFPLRSLIPTVFVQTNWRESFRIIILARVSDVIWSEKLSDKRSASKRGAYYRYVSLNVWDKKRDKRYAKVELAKDYLLGPIFFHCFWR